MKRYEKTILTNMCMVYDDHGNVLIQDRVKPGWSGVTFPGGHVEAGESFTDSVIREVFEETGLTITSPRLCGVKHWMEEDGCRYLVFCYKTNRFSGKLVSSPEGEVKWAALDEMKQMKLASGMEYMLELFLSEDVSEHFLCRENGKWKNILK